MACCSNRVVHVLPDARPALEAFRIIPEAHGKVRPNWSPFSRRPGPTNHLERIGAMADQPGLVLAPLHRQGARANQGGSPAGRRPRRRSACRAGCRWRLRRWQRTGASLQVNGGLWPGKALDHREHGQGPPGGARDRERGESSSTIESSAGRPSEPRWPKPASGPGWPRGESCLRAPPQRLNRQRVLKELRRRRPIAPLVGSIGSLGQITCAGEQAAGCNSAPTG